MEDGYGWAISAQGFNDFMHYLDDFLFWSPQIARDATKPSSRPCNFGEALGLPAAPEKIVGPTTSLTFLGIKIDTVAQQFCLPEEKLCRLKRT